VELATEPGVRLREILAARAVAILAGCQEIDRTPSQYLAERVNISAANACALLRFVPIAFLRA
jgi:hypothetical protein